MSIFRSLLIVSLMLPSLLAKAGMYDDLASLKKICDADLLDKEECKERRSKILTKYDGDTEAWFCNYAGETKAPELFNEESVKSFSESASASAVVKEILDKAGLAPNFIVRPANVPNAAASARFGERYIEYNPSFISLLKSGANTNWAVYSVMAHEIGHHLQGHTLQSGGSRPAIELEADQYSGYILAKLGATLDEAQKAMKTFGSDSGSGTHPPTDARIQAIKVGWSKGSEITKSTVSQPITTQDSKSLPVPPTLPIPQPQNDTPPSPTLSYTDSCVIAGEPVVIAANGAVLSQIRGFSQVGQKLPPLSSNCIFDILSGSGRYCVGKDGVVYFPGPVGRCMPCKNNMCN